MSGNVVRLHPSHVPDAGERDWLTAHELCGEAGITYRQAEYWSRTGLLVALDEPRPGSGYTRRYDEVQVTRARALRALLAAGLSLQTCRQVIDDLLDTGTVTLGALTLTYQPTGDAA